MAIDKNNNIYVADHGNHRIVKWSPGDSEGLVVAGGSYGTDLNQLRYPHDVEISEFGLLFIADSSNDRVLSWIPEAENGSKVAGGERGNQINQLNYPQYLTIDNTGQLYVSDYNNDRIQKIQVTPQLIIKAGEDKGVMTFNSIADSADEIDETIEITPISDATINGVNNFSDTYKITITDLSDPPDVSLALDSQSIFENSSSEVKLTASIPVISGKEIQIPLLIEGTAVINEEFTISSSSIIIDPGKYEGHILISTAGLDDDLVEII